MAFGFLVFSAIALINPAWLIASFGVEVSGDHGIFEMRSVYGGVNLGGGLLLLAGVINKSLERTALWFLLAYAGGYSFARIIGIMIDGFPEPYFYSYIFYEFSVTAIAAFFLMRAQPEKT